MVPLPNDLYARIASPLQLLVSQIASVVLNATNVPVLCEGNMMTLPGDVQMFVAEACSGMRQLTGFLALTTAVAYLSARPAWYRVALVASSIPIAMTANVARVTPDRLHHVLPQPGIRLGGVPHRRGAPDDGPGLVAAPGRVLGPGPAHRPGGAGAGPSRRARLDLGSTRTARVEEPCLPSDD